MASYNLVKRGVETITDADVGTSKDVALASPVKTPSSFVTAVVRQLRHAVKVQRGQIAVTEAATSPANAAITAVDLARSHVVASVREKRAGGSGASVKLSAADQVRLEWLGGALAAGEDIVAEFEVVEQLPARRGATARLLDADTVRIEWDAQLTAGESIVVAWEVYDLDEIGDELLEILFREQRILGELGINMLQDLIVRDDVGNVVQYRVRTFSTKAFAEAATTDIADGSDLEEGELSRRTVTVDVDIRKNDRKLLSSVLDKLMDTPGLTP